MFPANDKMCLILLNAFSGSSVAVWTCVVSKFLLYGRLGTSLSIRILLRYRYTMQSAYIVINRALQRIACRESQCVYTK